MTHELRCPCCDRQVTAQQIAKAATSALRHIEHIAPLFTAVRSLHDVARDLDMVDIWDDGNLDETGAISTAAAIFHDLSDTDLFAMYADLIRVLQQIVDSLPAVRPASTDESKHTDAVGWLHEYLKLEQPAPTAQVKRDAKNHGIAQRALNRARDQLGVRVVNQSPPGKPPKTVWVLQ